jgi:tripartite-type tricarboxylate transporter receptor subunit TctC
VNIESRLLWAVLTVSATLTAQLPILGFAQPYPSRPIRLVHGFATGGPIDVFSRPIAQKLSESFKLQVVVDSRPGATGTIANELVARSAPDGYTLLAAPSSAMTATPHLFKVSYNPIDDFAPAIQIGEFPFVLVAHPAVPIKTARDLIALAKAKPGTLTYGSAGIGSAFHLAGELFSKTAGVKLLHVPYRGGGTTAHTDLIGGRLDLMWDSVGIMLPYVQAGRLRAIGVTGSRPSPALPGVPAVAESGLPGYAIGGWLGVFAPAATPKEIIGVLNTVIAKILASADIKDLWKTFAMDIAPSTPEQFAARMRFDYDRYGKLIQSTGVKIEQ